MHHAIVVVFVLLLIPTPFQGEISAVDIAGDPQALAFFEELIRSSGSRHTESAAFLLRDEDGHYHCVAWGFSNRYEEQRFRGTIPRSTVAIVHTHPFHAPRPSETDLTTAFAFGGPVFVITPTDIYAALPDGRIIAIISNHVWRHVRAQEHCSRAVPR